ncbi:hypothetical protein Tco_0639628 [Tanacetum coccineum]
MNENYFEPSYNSSYSSFDQPPKYSINHQEDIIQQRINDVHNGWDKIDELHNELFLMIQSFCEKFLQQKQAASISFVTYSRMSLQEMDDLKQHYLDEMLSLSNELGIKVYRNEKIDICFRREYENMIDELKAKFNGMSIEINKKKELQQLEQEKSVTFSNPLFDTNDDLTSSDDESLSDKDVPEDNIKFYSNPFFEFDDEYITSDINPLFDEVLENIKCKDSYDSNLDESTFLVTPLSDSNEDE